MTKWLIFIAAGVLLASCSGSSSSSTETRTMPAHITETVADGEKEIYLAGGCFWGTEKLFSALDGVTDTTVGYANGYTENPTYEEVCKNNTGYKETVRVVYDPTKTNLETILAAYFLVIDPTKQNMQGNDLGTQYQTGIYYTDEASHQTAETAWKKESSKYDKFYVELQPLVNFYDAEEYHQDYLVKHPNGYCHISNEEIEEAKGIKLEASEYVNPDDSTLKSKLSALQYSVTQQKGTEPAFSSEYYALHDKGIYVDVITGEPLFSSSDKYDSSCGWPSFTKSIGEEDQLLYQEDHVLGYARTEVESSAGNHLGHRFEDDPESPNGVRYCIDGASLEFVPYDEMDARGYGDYKQYVK
ncbi:MAG: peptide-methionine (S)-S-oxide reductase MsrA [Solobacterium sp.]|jgi:peptide methionine sulfoxide reductase msrA/msrB|nr:peptide-methionine (S)-S-oxide reductase MsrA [Solobacterium sp.]MCH4265417.1 peptide-methionine (S)-S-oxide reductase MsrA [Solobacterium sp.]